MFFYDVDAQFFLCFDAMMITQMVIILRSCMFFSTCKCKLMNRTLTVLLTHMRMIVISQHAKKYKTGIVGERLPGKITRQASGGTNQIMSPLRKQVFGKSVFILCFLTH